MTSFIPNFHFTKQEDKLKPEWCNDVVQYYIYQNHLINLLEYKNIQEIDGYADGTYSIEPFKKMFRSIRAQMVKNNNPNYRKEDIDKMDKTGLNWDRVPLIAPKLNSAIATTQKIPIEITCVCTDPLAQRKKKEDLEYLKNKKLMEEELQPLYDSMNLGKVDLGPTKYSSVPYTSLPLDLNIEDDQEFMLFANLIYNLAPEAAFETILKLYTETRRVSQVKLLETRDQYKYAVSVNQVLKDKITGLPTLDYVYPGSVTTDWTELNNFSDNVIRIIHRRVTPMELFKYFPDEICNEQQLEYIVGSGNGASWDDSYCCRNEGRRVEKSNWGTFRMNLDYIEVKSVDSAMVATKPKSGYQYFTDDPQKCTDKIWGQNTYCFYWLRNTKFFFGIDKLDWAYRSIGNEKFQQFSTSINKTQEKSAVELSIGENKKAQIADIKLQHSIIMSMPNGKIIDMKYMRNVIDGVTEEGTKYTVDDLMDMALERNIHLIDSQGFENQREGQYVAVKDLPGGLRTEVEGYYRVILEADAKISQYTNINPQLTGQSANPEGLVGLQKLLINSSINGLYYVHEALIEQYTSAYNLLAQFIKDAVDKGGKPRKAIEAIIGTNKIEILDAMNDLPLHQIGVVVKMGQREEERAQFNMEVETMRREGKIDAAGKYYILNNNNPKDAMLLAAMFERKFIQRKEAQAQAQIAAQQQMVEQQGQNMVANTQAKTQGDAALIQAKGAVQGELMKLGAQLGLTGKQVDGLIKRQLQTERLDKQTEKSLKTLYAENNLEQQQPIPA